MNAERPEPVCDAVSHVSHADHFLDAGACLALLGNLYPLSASMLYFQLETFLQEAALDPASLTGQVPVRLLEHNRLPRHKGPVTGMHLLPTAGDIVATYDAAAQTTRFDFIDRFEHPGLVRKPESPQVGLHVLLAGADNISRIVSLPLQVLMADWGDVTHGYMGYLHSVTFLTAGAEKLEQWCYIGVASDGWLRRMDEHEREVRVGGNRKFISAWRQYAGAAHVVLASDLVLVNQTEEAILDWEEREVEKHSQAGGCLNMVPGGLKGMQHLHEAGVLRNVRVPIEERDSAVSSWAHLPNATSQVGPVPNFLAVLWPEEGFYSKFLSARGDVLTPGQVIDIRRLAGDGQDADVIAAAVGARGIHQVKQVLAGVLGTPDMRHGADA